MECTWKDKNSLKGPNSLPMMDPFQLQTFQHTLVSKLHNNTYHDLLNTYGPEPGDNNCGYS